MNRVRDTKENKEQKVDICFLLYIFLNCFHFIKCTCFFEVKIKITSTWGKKNYNMNECL